MKLGLKITNTLSACFVLLLLISCVPTKDSSGSIAPSHNKTQLMTAIKMGNTQDVKRLIHNRSNVVATDSNGRNALHYAAKYLQNSEIILALLDSGVNVNAVDVKGDTPLSYLIASNDEKNAALLIYYGAKASDYGQLRYVIPNELKKIEVMLKFKPEYQNKCLTKNSKTSYEYCLGLLEKSGEFNTITKRRTLSCSKNKYCITASSFSKNLQKACNTKSSTQRCLKEARKDIHGVFITDEIENRISTLEYKSKCSGSNFKYASCVALLNKFSEPTLINNIQSTLNRYQPKGERLFNQACSGNSNKSRCKQFIKTHPRFKSQQEFDTAIMYLSQICKLKEKGWLYNGNQCKSGFAHGRGIAHLPEKNLKYEGTFKNGSRTQGKLFANNTLMYDGPIKNNRPNGYGICVHKNEPEACQYYNGKRVDGIFKQRTAFAEQQKIMDDKLAKMQASQNAQLDMMQNQINSSARARSTGNGNNTGNVVTEKATEVILNQIFNQLF